MVILGYRRREIYPPLFHLAAMVSVLAVGYLGLKLPEAFDYAGHFGGLLAGVILALLMMDPNGRTLPLSPSPLVINGGKAALIIIALITALTIKLIS
jgi:membrane associated rhomboid family serine protease